MYYVLSFKYTLVIPWIVIHHLYLYRLYNFLRYWSLNINNLKAQLIPFEPEYTLTN